MNVKEIVERIKITHRRPPQKATLYKFTDEGKPIELRRVGEIAEIYGITHDWTLVKLGSGRYLSDLLDNVELPNPHNFQGVAFIATGWRTLDSFHPDSDEIAPSSQEGTPNPREHPYREPAFLIAARTADDLWSGITTCNTDSYGGEPAFGDLWDQITIFLNKIIATSSHQNLCETTHTPPIKNFVDPVINEDPLTQKKVSTREISKKIISNSPMEMPQAVLYGVTPDGATIELGRHHDAYFLLERNDLPRMSNLVGIAIHTTGWGAPLDENGEMNGAPSQHPERVRIALVVVRTLDDFCSAIAFANKEELEYKEDQPKGSLWDAMTTCLDAIGVTSSHQNLSELVQN